MYATMGYIVPEYYKFPGGTAVLSSGRALGAEPWISLVLRIP